MIPTSKCCFCKLSVAAYDEGRVKVRASFCSTLNRTATTPIALCLFCVAQGALHNAMKYSGTSHFMVALSSVANELRLQVTDSGSGFDVEEAKRRGGLGLVSMQDGFTLSTGDSRSSRSPGGTQILVAVPLAPKTEPVCRRGRESHQPDGRRNRFAGSQQFVPGHASKTIMAETAGKLRILLADDNESILARVRSLLDEEFEIVGSVNNGRDAVAEVRRLDPDVLLIDISMPILNGLQAVSSLGSTYRTKCVFLTVQEDSDFVQMPRSPLFYKPAICQFKPNSPSLSCFPPSQKLWKGASTSRLEVDSVLAAALITGCNHAWCELRVAVSGRLPKPRIEMGSFESAQTTPAPDVCRRGDTNRNPYATND